MAFLSRLQKQLRCLRQTGGQHELNIAAGICRYCGRKWSTLYPPRTSRLDKVIPASAPLPPSPSARLQEKPKQFLRVPRVLPVHTRVAPVAIFIAVIFMSYLILGSREAALPVENSIAQLSEPTDVIPAALPTPSTPQSPATATRSVGRTSDTRKGARAARAASASVGAKVKGTLDGWWILTNEMLVPGEEGLTPLSRRFRVQLKQHGERVTGRGEKWTENGRSIPLGGRTPVIVAGRVDGSSVALSLTEPAEPGNSGGTSVLMLGADGVLRGSFTTRTSTARGSSIAWRLR